MAAATCSLFQPTTDNTVWNYWNTTTLPLPDFSYCVMQNNVSSWAMLEVCTGSPPRTIPFDDADGQGTGCYIYSAIKNKTGDGRKDLTDSRACIRDGLTSQKFGNQSTSNWVKCILVGDGKTDAGPAPAKGAAAKIGVVKAVVLALGLGIVGTMMGVF